MNPKFSLCCGVNGNIVLPPIPLPPPELRDLFEGGNPLSKQFLTDIRKYNNAFAFTSLGCKMAPRPPGNGPPTFRIHGALYHRLGSLLPASSDQPPMFAQLYIHDTDYDATLENRIQFGNRGKPVGHKTRHRTIIETLTRVMDQHNPYAASFKSVGERIRSDDTPIFGMTIVNKRSRDPRTHNTPTAQEVAAIMPEDGGSSAVRDVVVQMRNLDDNGNPKFIHFPSIHPAYYPMSYPMLFPKGTDGFQLGIPRRSQSRGDMRVNNKDGVNGISMMEHFCFRLQFRETDGSKYIFMSRRLFHQFIVDMYAAYEANNLKWIRDHQKELRSEVYEGTYPWHAIKSVSTRF